MHIAAVVVAAGRGNRLAADRPKAFVDLAGRTLLEHVVDTFDRSALFEESVVVAPADFVDACRELVLHAGGRRWRVVAGGARRQDSVRLGLGAIADAAGLVAVHDAARPLVSIELLRRTVEAAKGCGAAIAALPVTDTVKEIDSGRIVAQPARERLWLAQTPQVFRLDWLREGHERFRDAASAATDDAEIVRSLGHDVRIVAGEVSNLKITRPEDLRLADALLRAQSD